MFQPKEIRDAITSVVGAPLEAIGDKLQALELKCDKVLIGLITARLKPSALFLSVPLFGFWW